MKRQIKIKRICAKLLPSKQWSKHQMNIMKITEKKIQIYKLKMTKKKIRRN